MSIPTTEFVCDACGGFVGEPGKACGYAGKWCQCTKQQLRVTQLLQSAPTGFRPTLADAIDEAMRHYYNRDPDALKRHVSNLIKGA